MSTYIFKQHVNKENGLWSIIQCTDSHTVSTVYATIATCLQQGFGGNCATDLPKELRLNWEKTMNPLLEGVLFSANATGFKNMFFTSSL